MVIATFLFVYFFQYVADTRPTQGTAFVHKHTISVVHPGENGKLSEKTVEIDSTLTQKDRGTRIVEELQRNGYLPQNVSLQDMIIDSEGTIYVNFTKDILHAIGKEDGITFVYVLVNSFLASFRYAKKVQFLVDWKPVYTLGGVVYTYLPLEFNEHVMED